MAQALSQGTIAVFVLAQGPVAVLMLRRCLQRVRKNITDSLHPFIRNFRGRIALYDVATHADVGDNLL